MSNEPLVSIALCTYNGARFLREQLDSLYSQDYPNLEFVICDDASTDDTPRLLREWNEPRARLFFNETRLGYNRNFTQCFARCSGTLIAPCDQDDRWNSSKISRLVAAIGNADLAYCDSRLIDPVGNAIGNAVSDMRRMVFGNNPMMLVTGNSVSGHASLFRRSLLEAATPLPDRLIYDWWLAFIAADRNGLVYLDQALVDFRRHPGAVTSSANVVREVNKLARDRARVEQLKLFVDGARGPYRQRLMRYAELMARRERQWFSPALSLFVLLNGSSLYASEHGGSHRVVAKRAVDYLIGLKLRRLLSPAAFSEPS